MTMFLEEKQLVRRLGSAHGLRQKEWWFTYLFDRRAGLYMSWSFARSFLVDKFRLWVCDLATGAAEAVDHTLYLDPRQRPGALDLRARSAGLAVVHEGEGRRARFEVTTAKVAAALEFRRSPAPFVRRDNHFTDHYTLLHTFHDRVRGSVHALGRAYEIDTPLSYHDHCFGKVPSRMGWQWLAAQSESTAIASLCNHGPAPQRYTQLFIDGEWHRLSPDVHFDYDPGDLLAPWRLTSAELDLEIRPLHLHRDRVAIPRALPLLVDLQHNELCVEARGSARIRGRERALDGLVGVVEEHFGRW